MSAASAAGRRRTPCGSSRITWRSRQRRRSRAPMAADRTNAGSSRRRRRATSTEALPVGRSAATARRAAAAARPPRSPPRPRFATAAWRAGAARRLRRIRRRRRRRRRRKRHRPSSRAGRRRLGRAAGGRGRGLAPKSSQIWPAAWASIAYGVDLRRANPRVRRISTTGTSSCSASGSRGSRASAVVAEAASPARNLGGARRAGVLRVPRGAALRTRPRRRPTFERSFNATMYARGDSYGGRSPGAARRRRRRAGT